MTHRELCRATAQWFLDKRNVQLACWEIQSPTGVLDVIGITTKVRKYDPVIYIAEIKVSRADLLQDLKKKKMLKYAKHATHCYLVAPIEAFLTSKQQSNFNNNTIIAELSRLGLPTYWGIALATPNGIVSVRAPRRTPYKPTRATLLAWYKKIGTSFMYRILSPNSPMEEN